MSELAQLTARERMAADVDSRLLMVYSISWEASREQFPESTRELVASLLRMAYGQGYLDALREDFEGRRGELAHAHGYTVPGEAPQC